VEINPDNWPDHLRETLANGVREEQGNLIAYIPNLLHSNKANPEIRYNQALYVAAPTEAAVMQALRKALGKVLQDRREHAEKRRELWEKAEKWCALPIESRPLSPYYTFLSDTQDAPEGLLEKVNRACKERREWEQAERQRQQEKMDARRAAREREAQEKHRSMVEWVRAHGSERLRKCVEEGIECRAIYYDERLAHEMPGWRWDTWEGLESDTPRNPPLSALQLLEDAQKSSPDVELRYIRLEHDDDDDNFDEDAWTGYACFVSPEWGGPQEAVLLPDDCPLQDDDE
jgi:hypothetical protein